MQDKFHAQLCCMKSFILGDQKFIRYPYQDTGFDWLNCALEVCTSKSMLGLCVQFVKSTSTQKVIRSRIKKKCHSRVDVLKLRTLVACQKDIDKQHRPDCKNHTDQYLPFFYCSDKQFVEFQP